MQRLSFIAASVLCACSSGEAERIADAPPVAAVPAPATPTATTPAPDSQPEAVPASWVLNDAGPFTFLAPADLRKVPVQGIDSLVGQFESERLDLNFDYGRYSSPLTELANAPEAARRDVKIDGQEEVIASARHNAGSPKYTHSIGVHFPSLPAPDPLSLTARSKLTVFVRCNGAEQYPAIEKIFESIRFKQLPPA